MKARCMKYEPVSHQIKTQCIQSSYLTIMAITHSLPVLQTHFEVQFKDVSQSLDDVMFSLDFTSLSERLLRTCIQITIENKGVPFIPLD